MFKKSTLLFMATLLIAISTFYIFQNNQSDQHTEEEQTSGAYEALSFFGESRTYPLGEIPDGAFYTAWEEASRMQEASTEDRLVDDWETMGPHNRGGRTLALAFNPQNENTLYAGSASGGLWRSYTAGNGVDAWERVETGFPILGVSIIEFMPGDSTQLFIGTGEVYNVNAAGTGAAYRSTRGSYGMGILRSNDGGETWEQSLDFTYDQNKGIWDIEIAPTDHSIIYAGTTDGVYKSTDGGTNWTLVLDVVMANDIAVHPNNANLVTVGCGNFASDGFGIYRTENGGTDWTKIESDLPTYYEGKIQLAIAPSAPDTLYASIGNGFTQDDGASWLCRSTDFGETWSIQSEVDYSKWQGWFSHDVAVNPNDPDDLTIIGIEVWKSFDGGFNIIQISEGGVGFANPPIEGPDGDPDYVHSDAHDVIFHPSQPNVYYVASDGGIHRSLGSGLSFVSCNGRYQTAQFYNGFSNSAQNSDICMGGLQDNGTIQWNGEAEGVRWTRVFGGDGSWTGIDQSNDDRRYLSYQRLNMFRTDNGFDWDYAGVPTESPVAFIAPYVVAPSDGSHLYAGSAVVAKSTNFGQDWTVVNGGQPLDGNPVLSMSMSSQNTDVVYAATAPFDNPSSVFVTTNGGANWNNVTTPDLPDRYPMDLQVDPTNDAIAYIGYSGYNTGHLFRTDDYGVTWTDISGDLPNVPVNAVEVDPLFPNNVYVGNDLGIFVSLDYGETWETYQEGLAEAVMVFDLKISAANRKLRAATHGLGAFQRDLLEEPLVAVSEIENMISDLIVFPNPVSDFATIEFELNNTENISVELLDHSGRFVKSLFNEALNAGNNNFKMDVQELVSGIYYVKINLEAGSRMEKVVVMK